MAELLKEVYCEAYIQRLAEAVANQYAEFPISVFVQQILDESWQALSLKARMRRITESLAASLPTDYRQALSILTPVAPAFSGYAALFFPDFVECYGLQDWQASLPALAHFTQYSSAEFAVRPFIVQDTERMMAQMLDWAGHSNAHIRRLACEGARPRLPWAMALPMFKQDPTPVWPILERLKADSSRYVQKSVANHLNDISKDHPQQVLERAAQWQGTSTATDWIIKHACRTLLKQGNSAALELFGVANASHIRLIEQSCDPSVNMGDSLGYQFSLISDQRALGQIRVELVMQFLRSRGQYGRKVFKLFEGQIEESQKVFQRSFSFKPLTTRKYYAGSQRLAIMVNGQEMWQHTFELL